MVQKAVCARRVQVKSSSQMEMEKGSVKNGLTFSGPTQLMCLPYECPDVCLSAQDMACLLYTSPSPRDRQKSRMPSSA